MIDTPVVAVLDMYVEPDCVRQAGVTFIGGVYRHLGTCHYTSVTADLTVQWRWPNLLFTRTCGYLPITQLRGQIVVLAVPSYDLLDCASDEHCSLPVVAEGQTRQRLGDSRNTRLALNDHGSNSGTNLLRHALVPLGRGSAFFAEMCISGSHLHGLAMVTAGEVELILVDAVIFGYL